MTSYYDPTVRTPQDRDRDRHWIEDEEAAAEYDRERRDRYDEFGSEWLTKVAEDIAECSRAALTKAPKDG